MKTTVELPDSLLRQAKRLAVKNRTTVKELIEQGLRLVVDEKTRRGGFRLRKAGFRGDGLVSGRSLQDWAAIRDHHLLGARRVIAIDTNILVYAHREESEWHVRAAAAVAQLAESTREWAIPWPCLHEFLAIVTHPRIFRTPTPLELAVGQVDAWLESPSLVVSVGERSVRGKLARSPALIARHRGPHPRRPSGYSLR